MKFESVFSKASWQDEFSNLAYNYILMFVIGLLNYFVIFKLGIRTKRDQYLWLKISSDIIISFTLLFVIEYLILVVLRFFEPRIIVDWVSASLNNFLVFLIVETIYYIVSSQRSLKQVEKERLRVFQYQYNALKSQINPHFLFNSLNILYSLVSIDTQKSKEFILALSTMYRYVMDQQNNDKIKLIEEFVFLDSYIAILKMRYHNQFNVEIVGKEIIKEEVIIPYTLQLLIENVTKHNVISSRHPMVVRITVEADFLKIENPINKKTSEASNGIGLSYLSEQYMIFGKHFEIDNDDMNFVAKVPYL